VGTCKSVRNNLQSNKKYHYTIISNPEFLAEGTAIKDLIRPSRVLLGVLEYSKKDIFCRNLVSKLYSVWVNKNLILKISSWSSELIKLASNSFLAQKLSSINTISIICEEVGGCINSVSRGIGLDPRIGNFFLKSSAGFGGSCFEKDVLNLTYSCSINNLSLVSNY
jgi:UDPglucose 6-dehydrogenase